MSAEKIIGEWRKKIFKPFYWLEGDEAYYIDKILDFAETQILSEAETAFNLSVLYGRDLNMPGLISTCKKYPMFGERQVVIVKEAQYLKDVEKLDGYFQHPQPTTVLIIAYRDKKIDARTRFAKTIKAKGEFFSTKKLYDNELPEWVAATVKHLGLSITQNALVLLVDHIGNDLARLENEIKKIAVNLKEKQNITEDDVEKYVGISKEFNAFELQKAIAYRDMPKAVRIIRYFESNPKAAPLQMILPTLYSFFSKVAVAHAVPGKDDKAVAAALGVNFFFAKDYLTAKKNYPYQKVEHILLHLHEYNLRSIGINDTGTPGTELLKELTIKIMN